MYTSHKEAMRMQSSLETVIKPIIDGTKRFRVKRLSFSLGVQVISGFALTILSAFIQLKMN